MSMNSIGDLAMAFSMRKRSTEVKNDIVRLNNEISTGVASDLSKHLGGSYARLTNIERDLRIIGGYSISTAEGLQYTDLVQTRLEQINNLVTDFATDLVALNASNAGAARDPIISQARQNFEQVSNILNQKSAGRSIFSGSQTDSSALIEPSIILTELENVISGATDASSIVTAIDNWFSDPSGFDTFAYSGGNNPIESFKLSETVKASVDVRANNESLKSVLKAFAISALPNSPTISISENEKKELLSVSANALFNSQSDIVTLQARVGSTEEKIAEWQLRHQSEKFALENEKASLIGIDPYETATRLEAAQFQLQSLYSVTVRLSEMSLANYLR